MGTSIVGEHKDGKGTEIMNDGKKDVGEFRKNKPWNITEYDPDGNIINKYVNGKRIKQ